MTFGQFVRTTVYHFRQFLGASFSGGEGGGHGIDLQAAGIGAEPAHPPIENCNMVAMEKSTVTTDTVSDPNALDGDPIEVSRSLDVSASHKDDAIAQSECNVGAAGSSAIREVDEGEAGEDTNRNDPELDADPIVQGELGLPDETIPPEIQIEVRGKQLPLTAALESLLFVADEPVEPIQFAKALDLKPQVIETGLERLSLLYQRDARGLRLMERDGRMQLVTLPEAAGAIEDFLNLDLTTRLSGPALETLAVIAYRQPVTRAQVESVRGVDCSGVLRSLLLRGLVEEAGRLETVGRPILYSVTDLFMQHFGLTGLKELPELKTEDADTLWAATELVDEPAPEKLHQYEPASE